MCSTLYGRRNTLSQEHEKLQNAMILWHQASVWQFLVSPAHGVFYSAHAPLCECACRTTSPEHIWAPYTFWFCSQTWSESDRSGHTMCILIWHAQPSRRDLLQRSCTKVSLSLAHLLQKSGTSWSRSLKFPKISEVLLGNLVQRSCAESLQRDLVWRDLIPGLYRDLFQKIRFWLHLNTVWGC